MDDDIDIEEHDVLDNPRIKSIFPDLSRVKIEIPDEEDIDETYNHVELDQEAEEQQEMLYQNEYSFETMTEQVEEENEEYEQENEYFYNNQIILGSKPSVDPEVLYQEALESNAIVYLENWEDRLKSSPCYCETCSILFPTVNALDAHKMISHSYLIALDSPMKNTARKSTVPSKFCNHCSKTFPDDTSLIKHLYELLPLNNFPKVKEEKAEPEMVKIKRIPSTSTLGWPKKVKSVTQVFPKILPKKIKIEKEVEVEMKSKSELKYKKDGKFFAASSLVPQSTLFQCNICQIGFVSCFSALQHSRTCEKSAPFEKCTICKRKIRPKDAKIHKLQHNYNDKLKIYTVNKNMYDLIFCKCPKCLSYFDELGFWAHYQHCKREKKTTYCTECDLNIATIRYQSHMGKHRAKKLSKKDLILIEFHDQTLKLPSKVTKSQKQIKNVIKQKSRESKNENEGTENEITLYYCDHCGCCQSILNYKGHEDGMCKAKIAMQKKYCDKCGLCFSYKGYATHVNSHERHSFTLKDVKIVSLTTGKEIDPPMPDLFKCKQCNKHFLYRRNRRLHICKTEKFTTCKICAKKFNLQAYKVHKLFHTADKLIPELLKKYNSIQSTWNIMFLCVTCDLVTMTYDSAVTHAQGHLNYLISDFSTTCNVCEVRIAEKEFSLHENLHSNNGNINRESFKILKYNYEDLFKKEWLAMFDGIPQQDRQQILTKSIYRLYKPPSPCKHCGLKFTNCSLQKHLKLHKIPNNNYEIKVLNPINGEFSMITGKNGPDDDLDLKRSSPRKRKLESLNDSALIKKEKLSPVEKDYKTPERKSLRRKANDTPSTSKDDEISESFDNISDLDISQTGNDDMSTEKAGISQKLKSRILVNGYSNNLYRCIICNQHYMKEPSFDYHAKHHKLTEETENFECDICHLEFSRHTLPRHKYVHHDNMKLKREDFVIFTETPNSKEQEILERIELLKKAKDTPKKQKITENHNDTLNISDDICQTDNDIDIVKTDISKTVYYKCCDCNVCFLNHDECLNHTKSHEILDPKMYIECKICNFQFLIDSLKEHMVLHHSTDFKIENLTIHEFKATDSDPKIDIYQAIDKVQSRQVSTTTDVGIV
uniref:C2H2-type domain-containing protein n=1 Tax=Heliothis virescens TaxID=7102 RepID=A0A2A4JHM8_HELVI